MPRVLPAALQPYNPTSANPFDDEKAAHVLARCGFGGTLEEIAAARDQGLEKTLDKFFAFKDAGIDDQPGQPGPDLKRILGDDFPTNLRDFVRTMKDKTDEQKKAARQRFMQLNRQAVGGTARWWLARMGGGPAPLQEKLTLFWHGHFTTSARDERSAMLMWQQNELLRRESAGNFARLTKSIARDPAMLDYLNNSQNKKQKPNENFAREVMELFTLGIGHYTENDIKEGARAFTGWTHDGEQYVFRRFDHDYGEKTFMGRRGNFDGEDIINIILEQPACAPYIAGRLWTYFVYEEPEPEITAALGQLLVDGKWELRPLLRTIFSSQAFFSAKALGAQIKSPVQLVVGTIHQLGLKTNDAIEARLLALLDQMGQVPLMPPNVKGWPGGRNWINTSTLFVRQNTCVWLAGGEVPALAPGGQRNKGLAVGMLRRGAGNVDFKPAEKGPADDIVDEWVARLIQRPILPEKQKLLIEALGKTPNDPESIRKMIQLIVSMPDYQLC